MEHLTKYLGSNASLMLSNVSKSDMKYVLRRYLINWESNVVIVTFQYHQQSFGINTALYLKASTDLSVQQHDQQGCNPGGSGGAASFGL